MSRIQKILIGVFLGGVLLTGIGAGVAFVEYSSFAYAGEKVIGGENLTTRQIDFEFEPEKGKVVLVRGYWGRGNGNHWPDYDMLEEDEAVPEGVIRYEVTHNPDLVDLNLYLEEETESYEESVEAENFAENAAELEEKEISENEEVSETSETLTEKEPLEDRIQGYLWLQVCYIGDDLKVFLQSKDEILNELRQKKISSYDVAYITDVKIRVNPKTRPFVIFNGDRSGILSY